MSRIGKLAITIPSGVTASILTGRVEFKGPRGVASVIVDPKVAVTQEGDRLVVTASSPNDNALWGTTRANLANAVVGVTAGWQKSLEMVGVGYKSVVKGQTLEITAGYSHPVPFAIPGGVSVAVEANTKITVSGVDKVLVGQTAARIRKVRKPEPYKGKGIKYVGEVIRRKAGKSGKAGVAAAK
jgi:large subunit ribosomal protein L6